MVKGQFPDKHRVPTGPKGYEREGPSKVQSGRRAGQRGLGGELGERERLDTRRKESEEKAIEKT